ncbi:GUN4 domain-containing protein [Cyanobium sp. HWJ4-Hawea]|uniref:GUN4 domain-containing protein n=1 Tax=Cyanobium sp. HWJ4-Hawea TaxID=2823713 RepID=UPI0020CD56C5|nr:GUN4 domain-containing protein [Cyanobium sp. HWJ4-Hawea]MCP9808885.1 GUN4 domain-containing protein [Cyanobium sp. HWJ4-Hawea]
MLSGPQVTATASPEALLDTFRAASQRQKRALITQLEQRLPELQPLLAGELDHFDATGDDWAAGLLIQWLVAEPGYERDQFFGQYPSGWLATPSSQGIDYAPLQKALVLQEWEEADRLTSSILRELAGGEAVRRGYVYYSEVAAMGAADLESLDRLWVCFSRERFGFSVQGRLLGACNGRWEDLWLKLGWKQGGIWTRYPASFDWSIGAPEGHMPLVNQLRGVRLMDALLQQPALQQRIKT